MKISAKAEYACLAVLALGRQAATAAPRAKTVIDLPGQRVKRIGGQLVFAPAAPDPGRAGHRRGRPRTDLAKKIKNTPTGT